jgi:hypothetical protein
VVLKEEPGKLTLQLFSRHSTQAFETRSHR